MSDSLALRNRDKLTAILRTDYGRFVGFVKSRLGSEIQDSDPEDVVSDVVLRLLERTDVMAEVENMTAFLFTALANRMMDLFRRKRELPLDEDGPDPADETDMEASLGVRQALSLLSTAEQAVWLAIELDGSSFAELAERWGEPIGTLLSRKSRASKSLRRILGGQR